MCTTTIQVNRRFAGPPDMGNGGYVSGLLARHIDGPAAVSLWGPTPLEYDLCLASQAGAVTLQNGKLIAEARPTTIEMDIPTPPSFDQALQNQHLYMGFQQHPFPNCFVCGPNRKGGDGLQIFPARIAERNVLASTWVPDESLADTADTGGAIAPEFMWAALDCPGGIAAIAEKPRPILLGKLEGQIERPLHIGEKSVVTGWLIKREGRKYTAGTAIFTPSGELAAWAKALWIEPKS